MLLVDERERQRNSNTLGLYLDLHGALDKAARVLQPPLSAERRSLASGDFGWVRVGADGDERQLPALIERKKVSDLVQRSSSADHLEQLRRMSGETHNVRHGFLLIEGDLGTASGFTAYGTGREARPGALDEAITNADEVMQLICSLLVDERHTVKALLCAAPHDTTQAVAQLSALLARSHRIFEDADLNTFDDMQRAGKKAVATQRKAGLEEALLKAGVEQVATERIARAFESLEALRQTYARCASTAAKELLLCPIVDDAGGDDCRQSKLVFRAVCGKSQAAASARAAMDAVDLTMSDDEDTERRRQLHMIIGSGLRAQPQLSADEVGSAALRRDADASQPGGRWLQLYCSQGECVSALHTLHIITAETVMGSLRHALEQLPLRERLGLRKLAPSAELHSFCPALMDAAYLASAHLRGELPSPSDPVRGSRRRQTRLLIITDWQRLRTRKNAGIGHGTDDSVEELLETMAWPLARATLLALLLDSQWHAFPAKNERQAYQLVQAFSRVCGTKALLGLTG